jgi:hypothetical protein
MNWIQMVHQINWNSVICAHTRDAAINVRSMYDRCVAKMPMLNMQKYKVEPFEGTQNIKTIKARGCTMTIGTAGEPDSVRSQDVKMAQFTEIAYYPDTEKMKTADLIASISSSIPSNIKNALIIYESTANGVGDFFYTECLKAMNDESSFDFIFVEWFIIDNYSEEFDGYFNGTSGKNKIKGSIEDFVKTLTADEIRLFTIHKELTLQNINWYRGKRKTQPGDSIHRQEFPYDAIEAFQDSGSPVYRSEDVERRREDCLPPEAIGVLVANESPESSASVSVDKSDILRNIKFVEDTTYDHLSDVNTRNRSEMNKLKIWMPPDLTPCNNRYFVVYDPSKGLSAGADYGVITVFDRYWKIYGGKLEVVAELRGREDKDIVIWKAAQIAKFYNNALLVIESNTFESTSKERYQDSEFMFETIKGYYDNLYYRIDAEKVKEGIPASLGYHTNRKTKPMMIATYTMYLREDLYTERSEYALNEARTYEKKKDGTYGAKQGHHDDSLMTRMIGVQIDKELDLPSFPPEPKKKEKGVTNESSF